MKYLYESHLGGFYFTDEELSWEDRYCEQCGDSDWLVACIDNARDFTEAITYIYDVCGEEYAEEFVAAFWDDELNMPAVPMPMREHRYIFSPDRDPDKTSVECELFGHCDTYDGYGEVRCEDYCLDNYRYELNRLNPPRIYDLELERS